MNTIEEKINHIEKNIEGLFDTILAIQAVLEQTRITLTDLTNLSKNTTEYMHENEKKIEGIFKEIRDLENKIN